METIALLIAANNPTTGRGCFVLALPRQDQRYTTPIKTTMSYPEINSIRKHRQH